ncbi:MAG: M48 family metallopeptidase [Salinibacter sp.]
MDVDPDALLKEKSDWILKQKEHFARRRAQMHDRRFEEGEAFTILGTERTVVLADVSTSCVEGDAIRLVASTVEATSLKVELEQLYREAARRQFTERADHFAEVLGVSYEQIQIRNQKTRWGSSSQRTGTLSINFRLLMAPPDIVDYVLHGSASSASCGTRGGCGVGERGPPEEQERNASEFERSIGTPLRPKRGD